MTAFLNPVSAAMQALDTLYESVAAVPSVTYLPPGASVPQTVKSFFDGPPREIAPPYLMIGAIRARPRFDGCGIGSDITMRLYAFTVGHGRETAWDMAWAALRAADSAARRNAGTLTDPVLPAGWIWLMPPQIAPSGAGDTVDPIEPKTVFFDLDMAVGPA